MEIAKSLDDAVSIAMSKVNAELSAIRKIDYQGLYASTKTVVPNLNWTAFFYGESVSMPPVSAGLTSVLKNAEGWELVIEGQWKEKIQLDEAFKVVAHSRLSPSAKPPATAATTFGSNDLKTPPPTGGLFSLDELSAHGIVGSFTTTAPEVQLAPKRGRW